MKTKLILFNANVIIPKIAQNGTDRLANRDIELTRNGIVLEIDEEFEVLVPWSSVKFISYAKADRPKATK